MEGLWLPVIEEGEEREGRRWELWGVGQSGQRSVDTTASHQTEP